jgi:hypothetical protein
MFTNSDSEPVRCLCRFDATKQQSFGFQLVAANASPAPVGYPDEEVVAEKSFKDDVPWIVVRLVQTSH